MVKISDDVSDGAKKQIEKIIKWANEDKLAGGENTRELLLISACEVLYSQGLLDGMKKANDTWNKSSKEGGK